jgi:hypothetical protein
MLSFSIRKKKSFSSRSSTAVNRSHRSFSKKASFRQIFEGGKTLWRERLTLDVNIIDYARFECYEVIVSNNETHAELSPRLYLSKEILLKKIQSTEEYDERLKSKSEALLRRKEQLNVPELMNEVNNQMVAQYIMARIAYHQADDMMGSNHIVLQALHDDIVNHFTKKLFVEIDRPKDLLPTSMKKTNLDVLVSFIHSFTAMITIISSFTHLLIGNPSSRMR